MPNIKFAWQKTVSKALISGLFLCFGTAVFAQESSQPAPESALEMPLANQSLLIDAVESPDRVVVVGERGHILLSEDRSSWRQAQSVPVQTLLTAVDFAGRQGWAVGHDGVILHSQDGGETWSIQRRIVNTDPMDTPNPLLDVKFFSPSRGFAIGAYGASLVTDDGGETWSEVSLIENLDWHLNAFTKIDEQRWFIAAEQGYAYRSLDSGQTWEELEMPYGGSMFGAVARAGTLFAFGLRGHVYSSPDAGDTWDRVETDTEDSIFGGRVLEDGRIVLVGAKGSILVSGRNDAQFQRYAHPAGSDLTDVVAVSSRELILTGDDGILRFDLPE